MTVGSHLSWRIFVLEDDGMIAMYISNSLDELGHVVVGPARTVEGALVVIENETIDMALLDVNLGDGATSYPVAEVLSRRGVPFAFLTGYGEAGLNGRFREHPVLSKPLDGRSFVETLRKLASLAGR
jgi:DNA-binding response OmpR family regulator